MWSHELYSIIMDSLFYSSLVNTQPDDPSTAKRISEAVRINAHLQCVYIYIYIYMYLLFCRVYVA